MQKENDLSKHLYEFIVLSHMKMVKPLSDSFKPLLSPLQINVLLLLKIYGPTSMSSLAERLMLPKQQMTQIAHRLLDIGFIKRTVDMNDRRKIIVELTEKAYECSDFNIHTFLDKLTSDSCGLNAKEKKQLASALITMNSLLQKIAIN